MISSAEMMGENMISERQPIHFAHHRAFGIGGELDSKLTCNARGSIRWYLAQCELSSYSSDLNTFCADNVVISHSRFFLDLVDQCHSPGSL
jgi:hypothetical protein